MNEQSDNLLTDDHSSLDELLELIFTAIREGAPDRLFTSLDHFWARLAMHIRAEHLHLFPALLRATHPEESATKERLSLSGTVSDVVGQLRDDHNYFMKELGGLIKQTRGLIGERVESSQLESIAATLEHIHARLRAHNELEELEIYPLIDLLFEPADAIPLHLQIKKELENLPPRFGGETNADI